METCTDYVPVPFEGSEPVGISCTSDEGTVLFSSASVTEGGIIRVVDPDEGSLEARITCEISAADGSSMQGVVINTSGEEDLFLGDTFGSLELVSCGGRSCLANVEYSYMVNNTGTGDAVLTEFSRVRESGDPGNPSAPVVEERVDLGANGTVISEGGVVFGCETELFDLCRATDIETTVTVVATPFEGEVVCEDTRATVSRISLHAESTSRSLEV